MDIEFLQAELERLFELPELLDLSRDVLGFDPEAVGGTAGKGSFVRALTDHCVDADAVEALCDAVIASKANANPKVAKIGLSGLPFDDELSVNSEFGEFTIQRKLGEGRLGVSYVARKDDVEWRLKVLRREATRDRRGLHRFLTLSRLVGSISHGGLPKGLTAGMIGDRYYVAHHHVEAQPLSARISRTGPMHINEARPLLVSILEPLRELHNRRIAHGDLKLDNVAVVRTSDGQQLVLMDAGSDRLRARARVDNGQKELFSTTASPNTVSPEQIKGLVADPRSDVYSFGAMLYEILSGKPLFQADTAIESAIMHLTHPPEPPSSKAPRGWVTKELDEFVVSLLHKDPEKRPTDAAVLIEALETLGRSPEKKIEKRISDEDLEGRVDGLIADPTSSDAAVLLEEAVDLGADPAKVAEAVAMAADQIEVGEDDREAREAKKGLLFRAARLYHDAASNQEQAELMYKALLELDAADEIAMSALEDLLREQGKYEDLIEGLLERGQSAESATERARALAEIGRLYATELEDSEQAIVAFSQALCEDPANETYPEELEKLAGENQDAWGEVLSTCVEATKSEETSQEDRTRLLLLMGSWYERFVLRPDLALPCFQAVVGVEPSNDEALAGMAGIYRKAQQWPELGMVLTRRADAAATPALARDLRAEAAEILEHQLGDAGSARDLYQQILADDPGHEKASEALGKIYERTGDHAGFVKILEQRADALRGEAKHKVLCRIAEMYEDQLGDLAEAERRFAAVREEDGSSLDALRGLDRVYSKTGNYTALLDVLEGQIQIAATPRQKITLHERIAGIQDEEFLNHEKAADAFEAILEIDSAHEGALTSLPRHYRALDRWENLAQLYEKHLGLLTDNERRIELGLALGRVLGEQIGSPERAMGAYEQILTIDPQHAQALESLAQLRESAGDADAALTAIEALAEKAESSQAKAEQYLRAAKLLEERGDNDGAIERYKKALDASPDDRQASAALRAAYTKRGDSNAAIELIERELDQTDGDAAKAKLLAEAAVLAREKLKDDKKARETADRALGFDPTNAHALTILGDLAFGDDKFLEAAKHYEQLANRADALEKAEAVRILVRYVDAASKSGSTEKALKPMDTLLRLAPDDFDALARVAQVTFEHGAPKRAQELYEDLLERFKDRFDEEERGRAYYRLGESARRGSALDKAEEPLKEALDLIPSDPRPLEALSELYSAQSKWEDVIKTKNRHLDLAEGDGRVKLLIEMGEIASEHLKDRTQAAKSFVAALEERPDDRKLLTKLMQLYSEEKDWGKLIDVVMRLADFVEDPKQKAKYLQTAAIVCSSQLGDVDRALEFFGQVMELDPTNEKPLLESIELRKQKGEFEEVEKLLKQKLQRANDAKDKPKMLDCFIELGELYKEKLGWMDKAVDAFEAAQTLDPDNKDRATLLSELYASDPKKYLDKAVSSQHAILRQNPYRPESYNLLRRLYTEVQRADPAWCLCQALTVLKLAEPDEERFFRRMRSDTAAAAQDAFTDDDWLHRVIHEDADPLLTSLFALIGRAIIAKRGQSLEQLGYDPRYQIDLSRHPYPMSQTLHYACGVLGLDAPPAFENPNDPGGLSFLHSFQPSIVMGQAAMTAEVPPQAAAFIAARHLTYFHPGMYVRHLLPTGTGLKAWLFAAVKIVAPQFPVATQMEGPVNEAMAALNDGIQGQRRDHMVRIVTKLLEGGALDLKKWVQGIDLTADRAGLVVCHDLETAAEIIKASDEGSSAVSPQERLKELVLYSVSEKYFEMRKRLAIGIDQ